ncbi:MAG TPA: pyridoxal 5'-phosphate synthase glutaminase subunit PdxT [Chloroflexota bacterium]|nr:pyridoxal 5'-phosphate synthase glutaminase subunit PdxT [Chloroflexota bacterium]
MTRAGRIGVLALQGGVVEHARMLRRLGAEPVEVRRPEQLEGLEGIILPGGESTTIGKLLMEYDLLEPLRERLQQGLPAYGTCAGMILLANDLGGSRQPGLGVMDMRVLRNAFGAQRDSFEQDLAVDGIEGGPFHAIFIRAPLIEHLGPGVTPLATLPDGTPVAARQGQLLASAFHPELSDDPRLHQLFLDLCAEHPLLGQQMTA